jgi:hypothetical protein
MDKEKIESVINERLKKEEKKVLNNNAIHALFGAFSDPIGALGKIFLGRKDAIDSEKQKIAQDIIIEMLCEIDDAISKAKSDAKSSGITIQGIIETNAHGSEHVVGVDIGQKAKSVKFEPGSHIKTSATGAKSITGLKIGSDS